MVLTGSRRPSQPMQHATHAGRPCGISLISLLLTFLLAVRAGAGILEADRHEAVEPSTYIVPVLSCGINNQKMDLRQIIALAKVLQMGLVLTGMYQHYTDVEAEQKAQGRLAAANKLGRQAGRLCFPPKYWGFMDFDRLFNRTPISEWLPALSVDELRQRGWDGSIDAIVHGQEWKLDMFTLDITLKGIGAQLAADAPVISVTSYLNCDPKNIDKVVKQLKPYRVVAMFVFGMSDSLFPNLASLHQQTLPEDACQRDSLLAERLLRPSRWVQGIASDFQAKYFANKAYLAVHIRPYPDGCLDVWKTGQLDDTALQACEPRLRSLHKDVPIKIAKQLAKTKLRNVFILSHPRIRHTIQGLLKQVNLTGVAVHHLDMRTLAHLAGCISRSTSFLAMVEEVIAAQAHSFIGTATSSITRTIVLMRDPRQARTITWFEHDEPLLTGDG